ncbi:MAG: GNAT family N-acetyltransferase, partial [Burkholderiaceae bacterium]|nr:GNAT family N-acetyltransferase [Microbacteriaceae bacterium]
MTGPTNSDLSIDDLTIVELLIPASLDSPASPGTAAFIEMTEVRNTIEADVVGSRDLAYTPAELLPSWHNEDEQRRLFVARSGGRILARSTYEVQSGTDIPSAWLSVEVLPEFRRRGIGSAVHRELVGIAADEGRAVLQVFATHGDAPGDRITAPTGFGSIAARDPGAAFLVSNGYRLAQVERMSRLPLPRTVPVPGPPAGYGLEMWEGPTPVHRRNDLAVLHAAMSTDPPLGETDWQPEPWDAARVVRQDALNDAEGRRWLTAAARHVASDTLVGFTQLTVPADTVPANDMRPIFQQDTVVLGAHRGHRLGHLIKAANLATLTGLPNPCIYTWNAEENRHMLAVNEALGFVAVGYTGSWRREV